MEKREFYEGQRLVVKYYEYSQPNDGVVHAVYDDFIKVILDDGHRFTASKSNSNIVPVTKDGKPVLVPRGIFGYKF